MTQCNSTASVPFGIFKNYLIKTDLNTTFSLEPRLFNNQLKHCFTVYSAQRSTALRVSDLPQLYTAVAHQAFSNWVCTRNKRLPFEQHWRETSRQKSVKCYKKRKDPVEREIFEQMPQFYRQIMQQAVYIDCRS